MTRILAASTIGLLVLFAVLYFRASPAAHQPVAQTTRPAPTPSGSSESMSLPRPLPDPVPSPPKIVSVARPANRRNTTELRMPKGYDSARAYRPKAWPHPTSLQAALATNPALAEKLKQRAPEFPGMVDFKLHWLPRFATCVGDRIPNGEKIDVDFRFNLGDDDESWVGASAEVASDLSGEDEAIVVECVTKTFVGIKRPILDPNHGTGYLLRTHVQFPVDHDGMYDYIR